MCCVSHCISQHRWPLHLAGRQAGRRAAGRIESLLLVPAGACMCLSNAPPHTHTTHTTPAQRPTAADQQRAMQLAPHPPVHARLRLWHVCHSQLEHLICRGQKVCTGAPHDVERTVVEGMPAGIRQPQAGRDVVAVPAQSETGSAGPEQGDEGVGRWRGGGSGSASTRGC